MQVQESQSKHAKEMQQMAEAAKEKEHEREKELIVLKETEKRKTVIIQGTLVGASFNPDQDKDDDGENDFVELAKNGLDAEIKQSKQNLEREKFEHAKLNDAEKISLEKQKLKVAQTKNKQKS